MLTFLLWKVVQNMKICLRYPSPKKSLNYNQTMIALQVYVRHGVPAMMPLKRIR